MSGVIDRFEEDFAVIELDNKKIISINKSKIPEDAKVGDVLIIEDSITIDYEQTKKRKKLIDDLVSDMWE